MEAYNLIGMSDNYISTNSFNLLKAKSESLKSWLKKGGKYLFDKGQIDGEKSMVSIESKKEKVDSNKFDDNIRFLKTDASSRLKAEWRPIKLKEEWKDKVKENFNSVPDEEYNEIFANSDKSIPEENMTVFPGDITQEVVAPPVTTEDSPEIPREINNEYMPNENMIKNEGFTPGVSEMQAVANNNIVNSSTEDESVNEEQQENTISAEDVAREVNAAFDDISLEDNEIRFPSDGKTIFDPEPEEEQEVSYEDSKDVIDQAMDEIDLSQQDNLEEKPLEIGNKQNKRYTYKPMSDEEIEVAREKIRVEEPVSEIKEAEKAIVDDTSYEDSEVAEDYTEDIKVELPKKEFKNVFKPVSKEMIASPEEDLHLDYSDATEEDVTKAVAVETSRGGLEALKQRALQLQEENIKSKRDSEAAQEELEEIEKEELEIKEYNEQIAREYEEKYRMLESYCEELEDDLRASTDSTEEKRRRMEVSRKSIEEMKANISEYGERMNEIDSIISGENKRRR